MTYPSGNRATRIILRIALVLLTVAAGRAAAQGPRVLVDAPIADLGVRAVGEPATQDFSIRNTGAAPLRIDARASMAGVTATPLQQTIAPGATGRVLVTLDTLRVQGPEITVTLGTNDVSQPQLTLTVKILVQLLIGIEPGYARYNYVQHEREGTVSQVLWPEDGHDFRVLRVTSPVPHIRVAHHEAAAAERKKDQSGRQWVVDLTIAENSPVGPIDGLVEVETDHPRQKTVWVPISGFVRPMFAVTPPEVRLGNVDVGAAARQIRLHVKNFAEAPIALKDAATDIPGITATIKTVEAGRVFYVDLTVAPPAAGSIKGSLTLATASAKQPRVVVPISGTGVERAP